MPRLPVEPTSTSPALVLDSTGPQRHLGTASSLPRALIEASPLLYLLVDAVGRPPAVRRRCEAEWLYRSGGFLRGQRACHQATLHVTKFSRRVALSRGEVAPSGATWRSCK